jgi:HlyD family secretion protein
MRRITSFLFAATTLAAAVACGRAPEATVARPGAPVPVETTTVKSRNETDVVEVGGTLRGRTSVLVSSRMMATVQAVLVAPGDTVHAGQPLVRLDDRDVTAAAGQALAATSGAERGVTVAESELAAADAALTLARVTQARMETLHGRRSATTQELDEANAALAGAEARRAAAAAGVDRARSGLEGARAGGTAASAVASFAQVVAPFDGIVTEKFVEAGQLASPGMPLLRVEDVRGLELQARVDASEALRVAVGDRVDAIFDGADGPMTREGRVTEVARATDADTRTLLVKVAVPPGDGLRPGGFGRVRLPGGATRARLLVPRDAVTHTGQLTSLFVVENGQAKLRLVRLGPEIGQAVEVVAGVTERDVIVTSAPPALRDGMTVTTGVGR